MTEPSGSGEAAGSGNENDDQFTPTVTSNVVMESFEFNAPVERLIYLDSVNSYLLLCSDGTACLLDANFETSAETIAEFGKPIKVLYAPSHGSLVLLDNSKVAVRRDLNGSYYVATALDNGSDQTRVRVEIPMDEAIDWHSYFSAQSPEELHVRPSLEEFAKNIESQVEKGKHSAVITVDGPQLLNELIMLTEGMSEATNCAYPMFPHGFGLMERLRLLLYPSKPYSYNGTDTTKGVVSKALLNSEAARRLTFSRWPHPNYRWALPAQMAEAGFFHQNKEPGDDRVLCFACGVCLVFWEPSDEPYQEHERHSPNCSFITGTSNSNVPLAVSMSSLAPIRWSANDLGANSQIVSSVTSTSEWVAVGQNTSTKPAVYLFSLDSAVQKLHSFEVDLSDPFLAASLGISHETPGMRRVTWRDGAEPATEQNDPEARSEANQAINSVAEGSVLSHAMVATELMALCCAGVASSREETGRVVEPETNICAVLIAGVRVEDWAAKKGSAVTASGDASEISLLNTVNSATAAEATPRILPDDEIPAAPETEGSSPKAMRPLLLVYHVVEIASNKPEATSPGKQAQEPVATGKRLRTTSSALSTSPGDTAKSPNLSKSAVIAPSAPAAAPKAGQSNPLLENDPWMSGANADGGAGFSEDPYDNWIQHDPYAFYENEYDDPKYAEKTDHAYNKLNEATENVAPDLVPLLYETSATSTVAMQCMRLPDELDSDAFKISTIAASDNNSGFVLVGVNRESAVGTESDFSSAIVAYARMDCVNMLQDAPLSKLTFSHGNIEQILLLHSDYFAMSRSARVSAKPAVFTESALVRFYDGTLVLFDPLSQQSVKIDVESAADVTIGESGTLTVLSKSGKIFVCDIAQHLPRAKSDEDEELAISMLAALGSPSFTHKNNGVPTDLIEHLSSAFASHPRISQVVAYLKSSPAFQKLTPMTLSQIWRLTRSDVQPLGASAMTSGTPLMTSSGAGYIQSSPGFQLHAASQWVESQQYYRSKRAASGSLPPVRRQDRPPATRSWVLSPGSDDVLSTYVFEMTILPGMPLSHVDVRFKFLPYSGGCPDLQVTVLQLKHDHRDGAAEPSTSSHAAHTQPMTSLSRFSENPDELRAKTSVVMGPLHLSAFIDATNHSSTVQLNASQLITAVSSEGDMAQHQGWLSHPHTYYLLVETLNTISAEQVVFRKAASSSNYATMLSRSSSATCKRGMASPYVPAKSTSGSSTSSHAKKSHAQMKIRKGALTKSGKPPTAYKNTGGYKGSWSASSSEKPSSASPWDIPGSGGSTQKAPTPSADLPQPNPADITCGMQWIEEISVTLYRSVQPGQSNDHLHRICLAQNAEAHSELIRVAAAASAEFRSELASNSFCHDRLMLAQHQALDVLLWLIGHWKTEANVRLPVRNAITCVIEHLPDIYTHGYEQAPRSVAHKWTAVTCALLQLVCEIDKSLCEQLVVQILRRLTDSVAQLYRVQKAGSLHWLLTLAFSVVYTSILYAESADVSKSVNEFLTGCVDCLSVVGQAWRRSWQSGVHVKLAQRYNLSGLPLELPMYDWPAHVLSIRSRTSTGSSNGSSSIQNSVTAPTSGSATPSTAYKALKYKTLPPFYSSSITSYPMAVIAPVSSYPPSMSVALAGPTSSAATSVDYKAVTSEQLAHLFQQLQKHNIAPPSSLMPTVLPSPGFASASKPIGLAGTPASKYYMYGGLGYKPKTSGSTTGPVAKPVSSSTPLPAHSAYGSLPTTGGDGMGPVNYVPITAQPTVPAVTDASATSQASASLTHETTVDEMQWTELFFGNPLNPEATAPPPPKSSTTSSAFGAPPAQGFPFSAANLSSGFSNGETDWYMRYRGNNNGNSDASTNQTSSRVVLGVDHMPGLLETEPLSFTCVYGSDHVRVYNRDTTTTTPLPSLVGSASGGSGSADATAPAIVGKYSGSINSGDLASLKRQLQQHRRSKTGTAQPLPAETLSEEPHSETQASSASTFGVPTTPKTTPFLTPTPLSPINSETNLASHSSDDNSAEKEYKPQRPTVVNCSQTLFKSPPILSLAAERMTAGARKFVVLDFGVPVLLTDVLLPACEFTSTVSVDAWRYAENIDSIRLLFSSEIDRKSVALSDITPPALVRYVKVTYTARQLYNTTCMIPLGRFYGTRFISAWQLYACLDAAPLPMPVTDLGADPMALFTQEIAAQRKYLPGLVQLSEDLRCRHQLAASDLRQLVNEERPEDVVKAAYKECASLRLQWNIARSIIQRIETDQKPVTVGSTAETTSESSEKMECSDAGAIESWNDCGADQLRVASNALLALLNQTIHFAEVRSVAKQNLALLDSPVESLPQTPKADMDQSQDMPPKPPVTDSSRLLTLETAVRHFGFFCKDSVPLLQSQCCAWLFHYGSPAPWWPDFFPAVLRQYFSSPDAESADKVFLILAYLCGQSVKHSYMQGPVVQKLLELVIDLLRDEMQPPSTDSEDASTDANRLSNVVRVDTALLSWALLLLSSAFDVVVSNKRKNDRWAFLTGEFGVHFSAQLAPASSAPSRTLSTHKKPSSEKQQLNDYYKKLQYFKKLTDQLDKMEKNIGTFPQNLQNLDKLQKRLETLKKMGCALSSEMESSLGISLPAHVDHLQQPAAPPPPPQWNDFGDLDSAWSTAATYSDAISNAAIEIATTSAQSSSVAENGVPAVIEVPAGKSAAKADAGPSKTANAEQKTAETQTSSAQKRRIPPGLPRPPKQSRSSSSSFGGPSNASKVRQYSVRLKLRMSLCLSFVRSLAAFMCRRASQLPVTTQLVAYKVMAKVSVHGAHYPTPLTAALHDNVKNLVGLALEQNDSPWLRHAVLCLLLDITDAEVRALNRNASPTSTAAASTRGQSEVAENPDARVGEDEPMEYEDSDTSVSISISLTPEVETKRRKPEVPPSESKQSETSGAGQQYSAFAAPSAVRDRTLKTSGMAVSTTNPILSISPDKDVYPFAFAYFDDAPPKDVEALLMLAALAQSPLDIGSSAELMDVRKKCLPQMCYRLAKTWLFRGEHLSQTFLWFDFALNMEAECASLSKTPTEYFVCVNAAMTATQLAETCPINATNTARSEPCSSAMAAYNFYDILYKSWEAARSTASAAPTHVVPEVDPSFDLVYEDILGVLRLENLMPAQAMGIDLCEPALPFADIDCSEVAIAGALGSVPCDLKASLLRFARILFVQGAAIMQQFVQDHQQFSAPAASESDSSASGADSTPSTARKASSRFSRIAATHVPFTLPPHVGASLPVPAGPLVVESSDVAKAAIVQGLKLQMDVESRLIAEDVLLQPAAVLAESTIEANLGSHAYSECRKLAFLKDTMNRCSLRRFAPAQHLRTAPKRPQVSEDYKEYWPQMGSAVTTVMHAMFEMMEESANASNSAVSEKLLDFYWNYQSNVIAFLNSKNNATALTSQRVVVPPLTSAAACALLKLPLQAVNITEQLWSHILKTLDSSLRQSPSLIRTVTASEHFQPFLERFIGDSVGKFGHHKLEASFGPAIVRAFGRLFDQLLAAPDAAFASKLLQTLIAVFSNNSRFAFSTFPSEVLVEMTDKLATTSTVFESCDQSELAKLYRLCTQFTKIFISNTGRKNPRPTSSSFGFGPGAKRSAIAPNVCFNTISPQVSPVATPQRSTAAGKEPFTDIAPQASAKASAPSDDPYNQAVFNDIPYIDETTQMMDDDCVIIGYEKLRRDDFGVERSTAANKNEAVLSNMLRMFSSLLATYKQEFVQKIVTEQPEAISNALDILYECRSAIPSVDEVPVEHWKVVSLADTVLYSILTLSTNAGSDSDAARQLLGSVLEFLKRRHSASSVSRPHLAPTLAGPPLELSAPLVFLIIRLVRDLERKKLFAELGGHLFVAEQLQRSIYTCSETWPPATALAPLTRTLSSMASQINGTESIVNAQQAVHRVDSLQNFAPYCTISSNSAHAQQLVNLLNSTSQHRRARSPMWTYHFKEDQQWLELTLTLPYQITLNEVVIRPHTAAINSSYSNYAPASVQVELCSDPAGASWTVLNRPQITTGTSRIRIVADRYKYPVNMVRIYLKRPLEGSHIGLSQIMLLGNSSVPKLHSNQKSTNELIHWITIFSKLSIVDPSVWSYAPQLPDALTQLFLDRPHQPEVYRLLSRLLLTIDQKAKSPNTSVVNLIVKYIVNGGYICDEAQALLAEVLHTFCAINQQKRPGTVVPPLHISHSMAVVRQRMLLQGVLDIVSSRTEQPCEEGKPAAESSSMDVDSSGEGPQASSANASDKTLAMLLWAASCIVWSNTSEDSMRYDTIAVCLELGPKLFSTLTGLALDASGHRRAASRKSACWLLCSVLRAVPQLTPDMLEQLGVSMQNPDRISGDAFEALGMICQSGAGFFARWIDLSISVCESNNTAKLSSLLAVVDCLNSLCVIDTVSDLLDNAESAHFLHTLMLFVASQSASSSNMASTNNIVVRLESSLIELIRKCLAHGGGHRERVAQILCDLLRSPVAGPEGGGLNGTLQQMILRLVLEDEQITVRITDVTSDNSPSENVEDRILHPLFGCNHTDRIVDVSLYALCNDLIPAKKKPPPKVAPPAPCRYAYDVEDDLDWGTSGGWDSFVVYQDSGIPKPPPKPGSKLKAKSRTDTFTVDDREESVIQLLCDMYSTKHPLNTDWSLGTLIEGLKSVNRFNHRTNDRVSLLEKCIMDDESEDSCDLLSTSVNSDSVLSAAASPASRGGPTGGTPVASPKRTMSVADLSSSINEGDVTDGFFTLTLRLKSLRPQDTNNDAEPEPILADFVNNAPSPVSTLQHFARAGGLALLSYHLQLQQSFSQLLTKCEEMSSTLAQNRLREHQRQIQAQHPPSGKAVTGQPGSKPTTGADAMNADTISALTSELVSAVSAGWGLAGMGPATGTFVGGPSPGLMFLTDIPAGTDIMFASPGTVSTSLPSGMTVQLTYDDYEFVDMPPYQPSTNVSLFANVPPSVQAMPAFGTAADPGFGTGAWGWSYAPDTYMPSKTHASRGMMRLPTLGTPSALSPHVIQAFGLFLRLDWYPELLVTCDRNKAKKLLKLAMGVSTVERGPSDLVHGLKPIQPKYADNGEAWPAEMVLDENLMYVPYAGNASKYAYGARQREKVASPDTEDEALSLFPFVVLDKLFALSSPGEVGVQQAQSLRTKALQLGIVDVIFMCLAHFAHQDPRCQDLRPSDMDQPSELVRMIGHVLNITTHMEALRSACAAASAQNQPERNYGGFGPPSSSASGGVPSSSSHAQHGQNYWAKGTGFGSGTTQQQWNVQQHVAKRKQDEDNVTCLLKVLTSYVHPQPAEDGGEAAMVIRSHAPSRRSRHSTQTSIPGEFSRNRLSSSGRSVSRNSYRLSASEQSLLEPFSRDPSLQRGTSSQNVAGAEANHKLQMEVTFMQLVYRSCLHKTLHSYLMNDSVLDVSKHADVYEAVVNLVNALAYSEPVAVPQSVLFSVTDAQASEESEEKVDVFTLILREPHLGTTMLSQLQHLGRIIDAYLGKIHRQGTIVLDKTKTEQKDSAEEDEENLSKLSQAIRTACSLIEQKVGDLADTEVPASTAMDISESLPAHQRLDAQYMAVMKPLQFESIPFFEPDGCTAIMPYHYSNSLNAVGQSANMGKRTRRLAQELVTLSNALPLSSSSSVFVRASEERLDAMKVLITGPADTPYANGCFEFDVWFPTDYPNSPMQVHLETTGNHSVRFNPNLYNDGKVCLSILNTWHGRPEERWSPDTSSFLQVIVSIQSLILVSEPYFNEPGYERSRRTAAGQQASREYDANIRQMTVRWAMVEMLRHPPKAFADVIRRHFWLKRDEVCSQVQEWIDETRAYVESHPTGSKSLPNFLTGLTKQYEILKAELAKLEPPSGLEDLKSAYMESYMKTAKTPAKDSTSVTSTFARAADASSTPVDPRPATASNSAEDANNTAMELPVPTFHPSAKTTSAAPASSSTTSAQANLKPEQSNNDDDEWA